MKLGDYLSFLWIYRVSQESCSAFNCFSIYKRGLKILPIFDKCFQSYGWERLFSLGNKGRYFGRGLWNDACFGCESHLPPLGNNVIFETSVVQFIFLTKKKKKKYRFGLKTKQRVSWSGAVLFGTVCLAPISSVTLVSFSTWWHSREWQPWLAAAQETRAFVWLPRFDGEPSHHYYPKPFIRLPSRLIEGNTT